jgi:hypothetical protein
MARRYQILGILSIYVVFILDQLGTSFIEAWRWILPVQLHFTSSRLVLRASLLKGPRSLISSNILLVFDLYTMLLKGLRSHDKKFTNLQLVLHMIDYFDYLS